MSQTETTSSDAPGVDSPSQDWRELIVRRKFGSMQFDERTAQRAIDALHDLSAKQEPEQPEHPSLSSRPHHGNGAIP